MENRFPKTDTSPPAFLTRPGRLILPYLEVSIADDGKRLPLKAVVVSPIGDPKLAEHSARLLLTALGYPDVESLLKKPKFGLRT